MSMLFRRQCRKQPMPVMRTLLAAFYSPAQRLHPAVQRCGRARSAPVRTLRSLPEQWKRN